MSSRSPGARKAKHAREALAWQRAHDTIKLDSKRFVLSVLCCGLNPARSMALFCMNNIMPPSATTFYRIQKDLKDPIYALLQKNLIYYCSLLPSEVIISFDGAWSHKRNAKQCIVTFFEHSLHKIVDFQIVEKAAIGVSHNYKGPSNQMEIYGLSILFHRWKDNKKVIKFCHDNDSKARQLLEQFFDCEELLDAGHSMKSFRNKFAKINENYKGILTSYEESLTNFMLFLQNSSFSIQQKEAFWLNSIRHYKGDHSKCPDPTHVSKTKTEEFTSTHQLAMYEFLFATIKFTRIHKTISTQPNESFNSAHAKFCSKDTSWRISYSIRTYISILKFNEPTRWLDMLFITLGIPPLHLDCKNRLVDYYSSQVESNQYKARPDVRKKMNEIRRVARQAKEESGISLKLSYKNRKAKKIDTFKLPQFIVSIKDMKKLLELKIKFESNDLNQKKAAVFDLMSLAITLSRRFGTSLCRSVTSKLDQLKPFQLPQIYHELEVATQAFNALQFRLVDLQEPHYVQQYRKNLNATQNNMIEILNSIIDEDLTNTELIAEIHSYAMDLVNTANSNLDDVLENQQKTAEESDSEKERMVTDPSESDDDFIEEDNDEIDHECSADSQSEQHICEIENTELTTENKSFQYPDIITDCFFVGVVKNYAINEIVSHMKNITRSMLRALVTIQGNEEYFEETIQSFFHYIPLVHDFFQGNQILYLDKY